MIRALRLLLAVIVSAGLVAVAAMIPAPTATSRSALLFKCVLLAFTSFIVAAPLLRRVIRPRAVPGLAKLVLPAALFVPAAALVLLQCLSAGSGLWAALPLLFLSIAALGLFRAVERSVKGAGPASLLLFLGLVLSGEAALRSIPARYLLPEVAVTPPLIAWKDKGEQVYTANGFRGKRPCTDCDQTPIRIFTMGGSSTYGIPMYYTVTTYAAVLERMLHTRRPFEKFEVYNGGIPGFGVFQILDALNRTILPFKPDIVTVNAAFNDGGPPPGWYTGLGSRSDFDGYRKLQFLRWVQEWPPFRLIHDSKLYGWFNMAIGRAKGRLGMQKHVPDPGDKRTSPEEFREGLKRIVALGRKEDFLPVFILEPFNRTAGIHEAGEKNGYHRAMIEVAEAEGVPLVDSLSAYNRTGGAWLFYDVVHSNEQAHALMAQTIYEALFLGKSQTEWGRKFFASRGISLTAPDARRHPRFQLEQSALTSKEICVNARAPYRREIGPRLSVSLDTREVASLGPLETEHREFRFTLPADFMPAPINDFSMRGLLSGGTTFGPRIHLEILSGTKENKFRNYMKAREVRVNPNNPGLHAVVLGGKSGSVKALGTFDSAKSPGAGAKLVEFLAHVGTFAEDGSPPAVALMVQGDGAGDHPELASALKNLGGTGRTPRGGEAFAFLGRPGLQPGGALEQFGENSARVELESLETSAAELVEIESFRACPAA